ncbi:MAG: hypothetical protein ACFFDT_22690 [Candidatus Hodarchaeota archaeon]
MNLNNKEKLICIICKQPIEGDNFPTLDKKPRHPECVQKEMREVVMKHPMPIMSKGL